MKTFYCLFEQSGTFKNAFKELGYTAFDFDIQNEYGETDFICDLFDDKTIDDIINKAKRNFASIIMFFPCTYFSTQQILWTKGNSYTQKKWNISDKIQLSSRIIDITAKYYKVLCIWIKQCIKENIPLIIENPYSEQSFLKRYLPIEPSIIDKDRRRLGDKFEKPTMWYFINRKPNDNLNMLYPTLFDNKKIELCKYGKERSEITNNYAINFIKTFII